MWGISILPELDERRETVELSSRLHRSMTSRMPFAVVQGVLELFLREVGAEESLSTSTSATSRRPRQWSRRCLPSVNTQNRPVVDT